MKIGVLECGSIKGPLALNHGTYATLYPDMMRRVEPSLEFLNVALMRGAQLGTPTDADGWLVSGSRHGAYDNLPWIEPTMQFLRDCLKQSVPVVGICFGHQLLAQAMGGRTEKFSGGWGLGVQNYEIFHHPDWMAGAGESYNGYAVHQDQVVRQPENTVILAGNDFCRIAALAYGDPQAPDAISVQSHPEFSDGFVRDLIEERRGIAFSEEISEQALPTLDQQVDNADWSRWIFNYFALRAQPRTEAGR